MGDGISPSANVFAHFHCQRGGCKSPKTFRLRNELVKQRFVALNSPAEQRPEILGRELEQIGGPAISTGSRQILPSGRRRRDRRADTSPVCGTELHDATGFCLDSALEGAGFEPSVPRKPRPAFGYSLLIMKSLSAADSAPQTSPLRPASCRTLP